MSQLTSSTAVTELARERTGDLGPGKGRLDDRNAITYDLAKQGAAWLVKNI